MDFLVVSMLGIGGALLLLAMFVALYKFRLVHIRIRSPWFDFEIFGRR